MINQLQFYSIEQEGKPIIVTEAFAESNVKALLLLTNISEAKKIFGVVKEFTTLKEIREYTLSHGQYCIAVRQLFDIPNELYILSK